VLQPASQSKPRDSLPAPGPVGSIARTGAARRWPAWELHALGFVARTWAAAVGRARRLNPWLLLLLPALYLVTWGMLNGRMPVGHSFAPNLVWSLEWADSLRQGIIYPRWMEHTFGGLGGPSFHFYGPLSLAMVMPFSLLLRLSPSMSVMCSFWAALLLLGIGVSRLVATLCPARARVVSVLAGVLAMLSPYPLCDIYVRAALAEMWGMAIFPWLLASLFRSIESDATKTRIALALWTAAFALCHPPTLLLGGSALVAAIVLALLRRANLGRLLRRAILPLAAGLALDAFYLVSAIFDQRYVNIDVLTQGSEMQATNRLLVTGLSRLSLKGADGFDGNLLPGFVGCLVIGVWALLWLPRRDSGVPTRIRDRLTGVLIIAGMAALMMTDLAKGIYAAAPVFDRVQFAWRWMAILTVAGTVLWGYLAFVLADRRQVSRQRWRIPFFLISCWLGTQAFSTTMPNVDWNRSETDRYDAAAMRLSTGQVADASPVHDCDGLLCLNGKDELVFSDVSEYQPLTQSDHDMPPRTYAEVEWTEGSGTVSDVDRRAGYRRFAVDSPNGGRVLLRTTAWLGWQVDVNGQRSVGDKAGDRGRMVVDVPPGKSVVTVTYHGTPNQRLGDAISLAVLVLSVAGLACWRRPRVLDRSVQAVTTIRTFHQEAS
jgi:hypothetical protein